MVRVQSFVENLTFFIERDQPFKITEDFQIIPFEKGSEKENCKALFTYLADHRKEFFSQDISSKEFETVRILLDNCYLYRKKVDKEGEFENEMLSFRLGGNIPPSWLKEHESFKALIQNNYLHHRLLALRLALPFDEKLGAALPICDKHTTQWVFWENIEEKNGQFYTGKHLLFETDSKYRFVSNYTCLYSGICKYHVAIDPKWEPFQVQDPKEWGCKYMLEVWTVSLPISKPPMFQRTHAYIVLKDNKGNVRSVGQDVLVDRSNCRYTEIFNRKPGFGKITTPDVYVFFPKNSRRFWHISFEITEAEHDRIIAIVEKDKLNKEHSMSVLKGNCVSYVLKILREGVGLEMNVSMHGLHILLKEWLPNAWYRALFGKFDTWYAKQSEWVQKGFFFLPFVYIPHLLVGMVVLFARQNNYKEMRDFSFMDLIIRPWKLSCEHPLALHRKLDAIQDVLPRLRYLFNSSYADH